MPDPAKSVGDIDDVLSSIRRLVAEQPVPAPADTNRHSHAAPRPGAEDRLVLTPALRVTDRDGPARAGVPDAGGGGDTTGPEELAETTPGLAEITPEHAESTVETSVSDTPDEQTEATIDGMRTKTAQDPDLAVAEMTGTLQGQGGDITASEQARIEASERDDKDTPTETPSAQVSEAAEALDPSDEGPSASADEPLQPALDNPAPETLAHAPANDAGRPETRDDSPEPPLEAAEDGLVAQNDTTVPDAAAATDESHVIGDDGWRPEMRLFDWDASAQTGDAAPDGLPSEAGQFESETGDANWPDETADRAALDLAAVRETVVTDTADDASTGDGRSTEGAVAGFTPIFSRRATGPAVRDASAADAPPATPGDRVPPGESQPAASGAPSVGDLTDTHAAETAETASIHAIAAEEVQAEGTATDGGDTEPGMTGADAMTFCSVRDTGKEAPEAEVMAPDPEAIDTAPLADDLPSRATIQDESERTDSGARLTVLVGKDEPDTVEAGASPEAADAPGAGDLRSIETRILEEEVLRRIVAEAVREELQGALGERITRNVRKLVRREIRLVLAADELD